MDKAGRINSLEQHSVCIDNLCAKFKRANKNERHQNKCTLHDYLDAFEVSIKQAKAGMEMRGACSAFLNLPRAERCYLLDREGRQRGESFIAASAPSFSDPRFKPLANGVDAIWARRHYFRRAINQPGEIQVSRPYLSIAGGNICVTLSAAMFSGKEMVAVCADLKWHD